MKHHGKGNKKEQLKRRRERLKHLPARQLKSVQLIDGNFSYYPVAYCKYHSAYLTQGLVETHRCEKRHCRRYERVADDI